VPARLIGWLAAILAMLITLTLVVGELTNTGQRRWWAAHPLTTDTVGGLLVLLVTILGGAAVPGGAAAPGNRPGGAVGARNRLNDAMRQLQDAAAPFLQLLHPAIRDSIQAIARTAEE